MKTILKPGFAGIIFPIILFPFIRGNTIAENSYEPSTTYQTFYDDVSPYGNRIDYPGYGNVWQPAIDGDFRPYLYQFVM